VVPDQLPRLERWRRADGQWFVRERGIHKRPPLVHDDEPWPEEGQPFAIDRPIYPDAPPVVRLSPEEPDEQVEAPIPPPRIPAVEVSVSSLPASVPGTVRSLHALAARNGWKVRLTRACGPRIGAQGRVSELESHTLVLRCAKGARGVALCWRYSPSTGKWATDGAFVGPWGACGHTEAKKELSR